MTDAQPPGSWLTFEMTTSGREHVWKDWAHMVRKRQQERRDDSGARLTDLQVDGEALHCETSLKTEGVELLRHRQ